jgi:hypothetical protein
MSGWDAAASLTDALSWALPLAVKATVVTGVAGLAALALRRHSAAARHLVWLLALAILVVLPPFSVLVPRWDVPILPASPPTPAPPLTQAPAPPPGPVAEPSDWPLERDAMPPSQAP